MEYFIPDITDIRVGYECEVLGQSTTKLIKKIEFHKVTVGFHQEIGKKIGITQIPGLIKRNQIRVPYLTKEQLEAEGWKLSPYSWMYVNFNDPKEEDETITLLNKDKISVYLSDKKREITICSDGDRIFKGECKDINTFRYICKLLNI